jgi:hypothetical protein
MGPVAQPVFKTGAAWQPHARSVRLRRRSVRSLCRESPARAGFLFRVRRRARYFCPDVCPNTCPRGAQPPREGFAHKLDIDERRGAKRRTDVLGAFMENPENVPGRVTEGRVREALALVRAWQYDLAPGYHDLLETCIDVVDANVDKYS